MEDNCEKYKIKQGDIIRFGRITTRIKEIKINKNKNILNKSIEYNIIILIAVQNFLIVNPKT